MAVTKSAYVVKLEQAIVAAEDLVATKEQEEFLKMHDQRVAEWADWGDGFMSHAKEVVLMELDWISEQVANGSNAIAQMRLEISFDLIGFMQSWGIGHPWFFNELEREMRPAWEVSILDSEYADELQRNREANRLSAEEIEAEEQSMWTECKNLLAYNEADWDSEEEWLEQQLESYDCDTLAELFLVLCEIADNEE